MVFFIGCCLADKVFHARAKPRSNDRPTTHYCAVLRHVFGSILTIFKLEPATPNTDVSNQKLCRFPVIIFVSLFFLVTLDYQQYLFHSLSAFTPKHQNRRLRRNHTRSLSMLHADNDYSRSVQPRMYSVSSSRKEMYQLSGLGENAGSKNSHELTVGSIISDTSLSQCLSPPMCINGYRRI